MRISIFSASLLLLTATFGQAQVIVGLSTDNFVALQTDVVTSMSGLNLKSAGGFFAPIPPGTTSAPADPFTFLLANNPNNVSYAAILGTTVDIGPGIWVSAVGYTGPAEGAPEDMASSAYGDATFSGGGMLVGGTIGEPIDPPVDPPIDPPVDPVADGGFVASIDGGRLSITTPAAISMSGLNLKSLSGSLIPIPPGDTTAPADPFTFLLANSPSNISFAAIPGTTVNFAAGDVIANIGYTGTDAEAALADMATSAFGDASFAQVSLPLSVVPEPSASVLGLCCCVMLLPWRRRVRKRAD